MTVSPLATHFRAWIQILSIKLVVAKLVLSTFLGKLGRIFASFFFFKHLYPRHYSCEYSKIL